MTGKDKMNTIKWQTTNSHCLGSVPRPWEVMYQFGRVICLGVLTTCGVRRVSILHDHRDILNSREGAGPTPVARIPLANRID